VEASGEDAVTLYLKEDQETLCPFKENTISPDSYEFFKNKTIENWQTTLSECQVFCMKMGSKCNFVHFNSEQLSCSWGKIFCENTEMYTGSDGVLVHTISLPRCHKEDCKPVV